MSAVYINQSPQDIFHSGGTVSIIVDFPQMTKLLSAKGLALYTEVGVQLGETIQYFLTFDDVTKFIHFGKGLGSLTLNGILFCDCTGDIPGLDIFFMDIVKELRGKKLDMAIGSTVFTVALNSSSVSLVSEPDTMAQFQLVLSVLNHNL